MAHQVSERYLEKYLSEMSVPLHNKRLRELSQIAERHLIVLKDLENFLRLLNGTTWWVGGRPEWWEVLHNPLTDRYH